MFNTVGKLLASLAVIYAIYYVGYQCGQEDQPLNHDKDKHTPPKKKENANEFVDEISDKLSDLHHNAEKSLRKANRSFWRSEAGSKLEDDLSDLQHEAKKTFRHFKKALG